jgi:hypothetical protein
MFFPGTRLGLQFAKIPRRSPEFSMANNLAKPAFVHKKTSSSGWWCNVPTLKNDGVRQWGWDDIPYMKWKIKKKLPTNQITVLDDS